MITVYCQRGDLLVGELVRYGFIRSYTNAQVAPIKTDATRRDSKVYVFINPGKNEFLLLKEILKRNVKIILLGKLCADVAGLLDIETMELTEDIGKWGHCEPAPVYGFSESEARIHYTALPEGLECYVDDRPFLRYDYASEWNNHGYGAVRTDGSIWSLASLSKVTDGSTRQLAHVYKGEVELGSYVTLSAVGQAHILWINRAVGFVDSQECRLIETFISNYIPDAAPCLPLLREVPYGYDAMVSMRLDCDEAISSAAQLFELYRSNDIPFSLAIKTAQETRGEDYRLLNEILREGGAILSHTANHKNNWGHDLEDARMEARTSRQWLLENVDGLENVDYAVSPFHQNPGYAVQALALEQYRGFVSGIVCNDPQYLVSRAGRLYGADDIVTHSQQCMLHGDCLLKAGEDELAVYKKAAKICMKSGAIFGYLDHPFSQRYQYGWESEMQRIEVHRNWIDFLRGSGSVLFESEAALLTHVRSKSSRNIWEKKDVVVFDAASIPSDYPLAYEYKGSISRVD